MFSLTLHLPTIICKPLSEPLLLTFPAISTTPTLVRLFSSHPQTLCWGFKVQGPAWKDIIPSVRGPGLPRPRPLPLSSAARGEWARPCADLGSPAAPGRAQPRVTGSRAHAHRPNAGSPGGPRSHPRRPSAGRCRASSQTLTGQLLLLVRHSRSRSRSRRLSVTPAACSRGGSGPALLPRPTPPRVCAAPSPDTVRAAATAPFPPSSLSASLPPRPASYFRDPLSARAWRANRRLRVSQRAPSLARHKDGAVGDCRGRSREPSPQSREGGGHGKGGQLRGVGAGFWATALPYRPRGSAPHSRLLRVRGGGGRRTHAQKSPFTSTPSAPCLTCFLWGAERRRRGRRNQNETPERAGHDPLAKWEASLRAGSSL